MSKRIITIGSPAFSPGLVASSISDLVINPASLVLLYGRNPYDVSGMRSSSSIHLVSLFDVIFATSLDTVVSNQIPL